MCESGISRLLVDLISLLKSGFIPYWINQIFIMKAIAYRSKIPYPPSQEVPFLARHPWVGYLIFLICGAAFAWLSWQVKIQGPITQGDLPLATSIYEWAKQQPVPVVLVMRALSALGRDWVALVALLLTIGWARRGARRELRMLFFGLLAGELWFQLLGGLVSRPRPEFKDPFESLIGYGYPSGHATTNVLLAWMVLYLLLPHIQSPWKKALLVIVNVVLVLGVCFSRMFLGLHYPTDILGGLLLGLAWGGLIYTLIDVLHWRRRAAPNPQMQTSGIPVTHDHP